MPASYLVPGLFLSQALQALAPLVYTAPSNNLIARNWESVLRVFKKGRVGKLLYVSFRFIVQYFLSCCRVHMSVTNISIPYILRLLLPLLPSQLPLKHHLTIDLWSFKISLRTNCQTDPISHWCFVWERSRYNCFDKSKNYYLSSMALQ